MKDLTQGNEGKLILKFAIPMLLGNVFQQLYNVVDSSIVGHFIGKEALSAVGSSFPILFALVSLVIGFATGSTILISQFFGAKKLDKVKQTIDTLYIVIFISSIIFSVIGIAFSGKIFALIELPAEIIPQAKIYFNIMMLANISMFGYNATSAILRGLGDSKTPLYFLIISTVLNIILDLLFVVVFKWGISGAAIATVISYTIAFVSAIIYLNKTHNIININVLKLKFNNSIFMKNLRVGLPSGFQSLFVALGMIMLFSIVNRFGTDVIAAYSSALRIDSFAMMPAMNFNIALTAFVGQNIGAKKYKRVKRGMIYTILMTSVISIIFSILIFFFSKPLMQIFTPDINIISVGAEYFTIVSLFYIFFSIMFSINAVFRGAGDTLFPMFITLFALWTVRIPLAYFLAMDIEINSLLDWTAIPVDRKGIWWSIPLGWFSGMVLTIIYYFIGRWRRIKDF